MSQPTLPDRFDSVEAVEDFMTAPSDALVADLAKTPGDIIVLGVGGKMGPTLARLAKRAAPSKRVMGVARFSEPGVREALAGAGVEPISADLLDRAALEKLPTAANVIFMAGRKFGATGNVPLTWAMNVQVPAMVAEVFKASRIVAFSTGCVYPFVPVGSGWASEDVLVGHRDIHEGERVQVCLAAANRDPAVFEQPDDFVMDRAHNRHLAFGAGIHRCIGAGMARMQLRVVLEEILRRVPDISRMKSILRVKPEVSLEDGLKATIDWFRQESGSRPALTSAAQEHRTP